MGDLMADMMDGLWCVLEEIYLEASAQLNSSDSSKQRQEARITELETDLNNAKSESYALKESIIDMKEKIEWKNHFSPNYLNLSIVRTNVNN